MASEGRKRVRNVQYGVVYLSPADKYHKLTRQLQ
jgi:hypothetical protein